MNTSRQTSEYTLSLCAFAVKVSNLPEITEEIMPVWRNMKDSKKHKCVICDKQKLTLKRYDNHMVFAHQVTLKNPVFDEYFARSMCLLKRDTATTEELKTISCDYDSETGKRYSEDESESESYSDDTSETESSMEDTYDNNESQDSTEPHYENQISTEPHYSSDSEDDTNHLTDEEEEVPLTRVVVTIGEEVINLLPGICEEPVILVPSGMM